MEFVEGGLVRFKGPVEDGALRGLVAEGADLLGDRGGAGGLVGDEGFLGGGLDGEVRGAAFEDGLAELYALPALGAPSVRSPVNAL